MAEATPRITQPYLEQFQHRTVRVLGRVIQLRGDTATIDANGQVTLQLDREAHLTMNHYVEIVGKVQTDLSIRALASTDFGANIDYAAFEAVVEATHRHKELFYTSYD